MNNSYLFLNIKSKIPQDSLFFIKDKINNASEKSINQLQLLNLKTPILGLVFGLTLGLFGADRFYKGDTFLGIIKCILGIFVFFCLILVQDTSLSEEELVICSISMLFSYIWLFVDLFLVFKGIKKDNLAKVQMYL